VAVQVQAAFDESLLILSDVHLGNDLNDHARTGTPGVRDPARRSEKVDTDLASLLRHYAAAPPAGKRWRLVIAGDFIDFIGMAILPAGRTLDTPPDDEERAHGLGNAADHGRVKMQAVAARHGIVFEALAAFVAAGHALTIVHGNHDVEFHWDGVKQELRDLLGSLSRTAGNETQAEAFQARIEFAPWFYYVGGVAYVEHGHQYDTLCSTANVMAPLSPLDPRRIVRSFSDVLLRFVVRPTRGVPEYGHDRMGLLDYVMLGVRLGVRGMVQLGTRFFLAVWELLMLRRGYLSGAARALGEEHERRMAALADRTRIGIEKLRAIMALQVPPVTQSVPKILASVLLDRLALGMAATTAILALVVLGPRHWWCWSTAAAVVGAWIVTHRYLSARRRRWFGEHLDNDQALIDRAGALSGLLPVAFVVMGHTHQPARVPVGTGAAEYINVGSWHEAEPSQPDAPGAYRAARTHLVIHPAPDGPVAEFLAWKGDGPSRFIKSESGRQGQG
jgi:UDP-2,3-diacylglucosamine pyrophosphatase LpxH